MNLKNISDLIPTYSLFGHLLGKPQKEQERIRQERAIIQQERKQAQEARPKNVEHLTFIAGQYGYGPDSKELTSLTQCDSLTAEQLIATAFTKEDKWRDVFDPRSSHHVEFRNGALVVRRRPDGLIAHPKNFGASCVDIVRAWLAKEWEQTCDRIVIDSNETTFFDGDTPVVIFTNSGRDLPSPGLEKLGGIYNAADILHNIALLPISQRKLTEDMLFRSNADIVLVREYGLWTWPLV